MVRNMIFNRKLPFGRGGAALAVEGLGRSMIFYESKITPLVPPYEGGYLELEKQIIGDINYDKRTIYS